MQTALRIQAIVQPKGKLEIVAPELPTGKTVEVIILLPEIPGRPHQQPKPAAQQSVVDILAQASGHRLFKTAEEVDTYLQQERAFPTNSAACAASYSSTRG
jgi:hypothetical protein